MRHVGRSAAVALAAICAAIVLAFASTFTSVVTLTATALFMGGTGHPLSVPLDTPDFINSYVNGANSNYVAPSGLCTGGSLGCAPVAVYTPEQFKFDTGFKDMTFDQSVAVGRTNLDNCIRGNPCTVTHPPTRQPGRRNSSLTLRMWPTGIPRAPRSPQTRRTI